MTDDGKWKGEGNYAAARQYDEGATAHAKDKDKVKAEAEAAKKALDGPEGDTLKAAEDEGKSHARS
ncbi:hypothetical protein O4H52_05360 [Sphingomonadaceae bacterium G21617-S1]|jgi:hypothetical protein|nr:hypothetical protein [Sphingomonadaceae bacterium G21617-S1]